MAEERRLEILMPHLAQLLVIQCQGQCEYDLKLRYQPSDLAAPLPTESW